MPQTWQPSDRRLPGQAAGLDKRILGVRPEMVEACRQASRIIGGPSLVRLGVVSAMRGEGRTSVALAMATVQREDYGRTVAIVELDFENPALAKRDEHNPWPGVAELARGEAPVAAVLQRLADGVHVVTAGMVRGTVARVIMDVVKSDALALVGGHVDVVIADLPPLLAGGPGFAAARAFDNLLLVVRAGVTPIARVKEATLDLQVTPHILLNDTHSSLPRWLVRLLEG